jgi:hypothetical protein
MLNDFGPVIICKSPTKVVQWKKLELKKKHKHKKSHHESERQSCPRKKVYKINLCYNLHIPRLTIN